jgi:uncharacterized protein (TIGR03067 family)
MPTDLAKLEGTWMISALEMDGAEVAAAVFDGASIAVSGDHFVSIGMGAPYEGTVEIDQTKRPKIIDLLITVGHAEGTRHRGIYELRGDRWTICLAMRGDRRPRAFATKPETGLVLQTLERAGGATRSSSAKTTRGETRPRASKRTHASGGEAAGGSPTAWEGDWQMVSGVFSGAPMAEDMVKWCTRVTRGDITTVMAGSQVMLKARLSLDDSVRPSRVEYVNLAGSNKGKSQAGIAEVDGDTMRVCVSAPGKPRPSDFSSSRGDGRSLTVWKLQTGRDVRSGGR